MAEYEGPEWTAQAIEMWSQGHTHEAIGERFATTSKRVGQILALNADRLPSRPWTSAAALAGIVDRQMLAGWVAEGWVRRGPRGRLYHRDDTLAVAKRLMERRCEYPGCEGVLGSLIRRHRFCPEHVVEVERYRYPAMTDEQRRRVEAAKKRWRARNPEVVREIRNRAKRAFRERQGAALSG